MSPQNPGNDRFLVAHVVAGSKIMAMDIETQEWRWIATSASTGLSYISFPVFSPDGSMVAFAGTRANKQMPYYGVYKVPFFGGQATRVTEVVGRKNQFGYQYMKVFNWSSP